MSYDLLYHKSPATTFSTLQEEHWVKVHKQHCKFLSGKRTADGTKHDPDTCKSCQEDLGEVKKPDNAMYGCHYNFFCTTVNGKSLMGVEVKSKEGDLIQVPTPFSWSPSPAKSSRIERTVFVMQRVLFKMHMTKHKITLKYPEEMNILRQVLPIIQGNCWQTAIYYPREAWPELSLHLVTGWFKTYGLNPIFEKIGCDKNMAAYRDPFDLWAIFQMLAGFIYNRLDTSMKVLEKVPVESYPEEVKVLVKNLSADRQFFIWDQVLGALGDHLVPYSHLVEIFCWNETRRSCDACQKDTTIEMVKQEVGGDLELRPFISEYAGWVTCHREACFTKIRKHYADTVALLLGTFIEKQRSSFKCDNCFFLCEKVHRCGRCLTKQYCSKECKSEDWKRIHEKVCKPGDDSGKIKEDRTARFAERDQTLEEWHKFRDNRRPGSCKGPPICRCCAKS